MCGARHFVERHFVYCDTSSKVFVELPVRRKKFRRKYFRRIRHLRIAGQRIHMKYQVLFSSKDKRKESKVSSAAILIGSLRVKHLFRPQ